MPRFEPFTALRYSSDHDLGDVCAPPYDVLSDQDRERWGLHDERNIVHLDVPVGDATDRYERAGRLLNEWVDKRILVRDENQSFTIYRMEFVDSLGRARRTVGVLGALEVCDEGSGGVLPHERTTPKAKTDRLELTRATLANLSPVWGLSLATGLTDLLADHGEVLGSFVDENRVRHTVERVVDPGRVADIQALVSSHPIVIADGHHRYAISRTFRDECRQTRKLPASELTLTYVNELVEDQLSVQAIHRLYRGVSLQDLHDQLTKFFDASPGPKVEPSLLLNMLESDSIALVDSSMNVTMLKPKAGLFAGVRDLDSARLEHALAGLAHEVAYQHGFHEVIHELNNESVTAAIFIRPVSVAEIQRTAHEGLLMPPKSTFFTPKLRTGIVIRELDV